MEKEQYQLLTGGRTDISAWRLLLPFPFSQGSSRILQLAVPQDSFRSPGFSGPLNSKCNSYSNTIIDYPADHSVIIHRHSSSVLFDSDQIKYNIDITFVKCFGPTAYCCEICFNITPFFVSPSNNHFFHYVWNINTLVESKSVPFSEYCLR